MKSVMRISPGEDRDLVLLKKLYTRLMQLFASVQKVATEHGFVDSGDGVESVQMAFPHQCNNGCHMVLVDPAMELYVCSRTGNYHQCGQQWCNRGIYSFDNGGYVCSITNRFVYNDLQGQLPFGYSVYGDNMERNGMNENELSKDDLKPQAKRTDQQRRIDRDVEMAIRELERKSQGRKLNIEERREVKKAVAPYARKQFKQETNQLSCDASNLLSFLMPELKCDDPIHRQIGFICTQTWLTVINSDIYLKGEQNYHFHYHVVGVCMEMLHGFTLRDGTVLIPCFPMLKSIFPAVNALTELFKRRRQGKLDYKANQQTQTCKLLKRCLAYEHERAVVK